MNDTENEMLVANRYLITMLSPVYVKRVDGVPIFVIWKNDPEHLKSPYRTAETLPVTYRFTDDHAIIFDIGSHVKLKQISVTLDTPVCIIQPSGSVSLSKD